MTYLVAAPPDEQAPMGYVHPAQGHEPGGHSGRGRPLACSRCYPLPRLSCPPEPSPSGGPMTDLATNVLRYGDNLDILRRYLVHLAT